MLKNKKGVTLLELILALAIMSIVIAVSYTVFNFAVKDYQRETVDVDNQQNVRYAISYLNRQIRRADDVEVAANVLKLKDSAGNVTEYKLVGEAINRNLTTLVNGIKTFNVSTDGKVVDIYIESVDNSIGDSFELSSEITLRK